MIKPAYTEDAAERIEAMLDAIRRSDLGSAISDLGRALAREAASQASRKPRPVRGRER